MNVLRIALRVGLLSLETSRTGERGNEEKKEKIVS
jgi:hypothetical protein